MSLPYSEEQLRKAWPWGEKAFKILKCPITKSVMTDPVVTASGKTYDRDTIEGMFGAPNATGHDAEELYTTNLVPNHALRSLMRTLIDLTEKRSEGGTRARSE